MLVALKSSFSAADSVSRRSGERSRLASEYHLESEICHGSEANEDSLPFADSSRLDASQVTSRSHGPHRPTCLSRQLQSLNIFQRPRSISSQITLFALH